MISSRAQVSHRYELEARPDLLSLRIPYNVNTNTSLAAFEWLSREGTRIG